MSAPTHAIDATREPPLVRQTNEPAPVGGQFQVIREMVGNFDSLTIAGQRHVMEKIVGFVATRTEAMAARTSRRNRASVFEILGRLREESQRLVPDPLRFTRHAENLMALLAAVR